MTLSLVRTLCVLLVPAMVPVAQAASPAELAAGYAAQAGAPPSAARGELFFTSRHGGEWSCASCHGTPPTQAGKHAATGKTIGALAPGFNPQRFTDPAKVEKWLREGGRARLVDDAQEMRPRCMPQFPLEAR
jgi:hypothetical protein